MISNPKPRLNDVFPGWLTGAGIFSALQAFPVPWQSESISVSLDIEYHGNVSGEKIISPLVDKIRSGDVLTNAEKTALATAILAINGVNWEKQWETMSFDYNPIENYRMNEKMEDDETVIEYGKTSTRTDNLTHTKTGTETESPDTTETRTDNLTHGKTGTEKVEIDSTDTRTDNLTHGKTGTEKVEIDSSDTRTDNLTHGKSVTDTLTHNTTDTTTPNLTTTNDNSVYGFNSASAVPTGEQIQVSTGNNIVKKTGTEQTSISSSETDTGTQTTVKDETNETTFNTSETDTGTQTIRNTGENELEYDLSEQDTGTQTVADTGTDTHTRNYELTRFGNIGVTTSQQMIQSERDLWVWNFFHNVVFPDIDRVLTLQIY